jgi:hypothetical protein
MIDEIVEEADDKLLLSTNDEDPVTARYEDVSRLWLELEVTVLNWDVEAVDGIDASLLALPVVEEEEPVAAEIEDVSMVLVELQVVGYVGQR